jgi:hypothetical protein
MSEQKLDHPGWDKENSLTSPSDRVRTNNWKPDQGSSALSEEEVNAALSELNNKSYVKQFRRVERRYADPLDPMQRFGLFSFVPAKGATPNEKGVYGFAKLRGNFPTSIEADEKAEDLIRNVDSYHQIYHTYVGRPIPLCTTSNYSGDTREVELRGDMAKSVSNSIKQKKKGEQQQIAEIEDRERMLHEEADTEDQDPIEKYTTLRVKKAQVTWTYLETVKKLESMKSVIVTTRDEIKVMEAESEDYRRDYFAKYAKAREDVGLDSKVDDESFMKFLVEDGDLELGF